MNAPRTISMAVTALVLAVVVAVWLPPDPEPDVDPNDFKNPVSAVVFGNLEAVKRHVEKDPKLLEKRDDAGRTLLDWAADENKPDVVRYLLKKGAKVNQCDTTGSYTPLMLAAGSMKAFAVKSGRILIDHGANVNWRVGDGGLDAQYATSIRAALGLPGGLRHPRGRTQAVSRSVLDEAARSGHAGLVKLLLKKGASPYSYFRLFRILRT
jgi:uncharacterized protein